MQGLERKLSYEIYMKYLIGDVWTVQKWTEILYKLKWLLQVLRSLYLKTYVVYSHIFTNRSCFDLWCFSIYEDNKEAKFYSL